MPDPDPTHAPRVVVNFHGIGRPGRALEPGEERFWIPRDRFRRILDALAAARDGILREITFDDGNASDAEIAAPELAERGLTATFFLLVGRIGAPGSLAEGDIRALAAAGHRIGLHGHAHVDWRSLDEAGRAREFDAARERLAALAGRPVDLAAAPFGLYDRRVTAALRARGFRALHTSDRGRVRGRPFLVPRNCLRADMSAADEARALSGTLSTWRAGRRLLGLARRRLLPIGA
jgi:peptidoglycan/xylan/chitin deacetylase (PgdA/CDA1 family)